MRTREAEIMALTLLIGLASLAAAQQAPPAGKPPDAVKPQPGAPGMPPGTGWMPPRKSSLEEMLTQALRNNPDIQVASIKVLEAEAKLKRTRLEVAQKVVALYNSIQTQKAIVKGAEIAFAHKREMIQRGTIPSSGLVEAEQTLTLAKAKLAELEAELPYLLGKEEQAGKAASQGGGASYRLTHVPAVNQTEAYFELREKPEIRGAMAERIRKALDTPVTAKFRGASLEEVLDLLKKKAPGIVIQEKVNSSEAMQVSGEFENLPLGAVLEWLQDELQSRAVGMVHIVVREYGLLFVTGDVPSGAVPVRDFWKKGGSKTTDPDAAIKEELKRFLKEHPDSAHATKVREMLKLLEQEERKPIGTWQESRNDKSSEGVEGVIKKVDGQSGLVTISVGSEAGLGKGDTLEVFRLKPKPVYLGRIRIIEATGSEAVGQPVGKLMTSPHLGDRVASRIAERN